jgi:hypothetical protein
MASITFDDKAFCQEIKDLLATANRLAIWTLATRSDLRRSPGYPALSISPRRRTATPRSWSSSAASTARFRTACRSCRAETTGAAVSPACGDPQRQVEISGSAGGELSSERLHNGSQTPAIIAGSYRQESLRGFEKGRGSSDSLAVDRV